MKQLWLFSAPIVFVLILHPAGVGIWFNSDNIHLLRQRWHSPEYAEIVNWYKNDQSSLSLALEGLATDNPAKCEEAASTVNFVYRPEGSGKLSGFTDEISLVFDWCYHLLDLDQRLFLLSKIQSLRNEHLNNPERGVRNYFRWHEQFRSSAFAYIAAVLAIEGEPGVTSELREAQNVLQNLQELGDEISADGGYRDYFYQGTFQILPFLMWSYATDTDFAARSQFTRNLTSWAVSRHSPTGEGSLRGPADDVATGTGYTRNHMAPGGFYLLASHFDDPVSQWHANQLKNNLTQTRPHWQDGGPAFISLIHYDPERDERSPREENLAAAALFDSIGMVHARSSWAPDADVVHAWFYNGPSAEHSGENQNHFTIWRGNTPLIMKGGNYLGKPSRYHDHYYERAISNNTVLFSPIGSENPDHDGGQTYRWAHTELSKEKYPVAERVGTWSGQHMYAGEIVHYDSLGNYLVASGDASLAYDPEHVSSYIRDFVYLRPNVFLIRDRFETDGVASIRSVWHSRHRPLTEDDPLVIQGDSNSGILETNTDRFSIENAGSRATIQVFWPPEPTLRMIGGTGYEGFADGYNSNPQTDCQSWLRGHPQLAERVALIEGQWRTEIEVLPDEAEGEVLMAIHVSQSDSSAKPAYSIQREDIGTIVNVMEGNKTTQVLFPASGPPRVSKPVLHIGRGPRLAPLPITNSGIASESATPQGTVTALD
jgi:hypothetical protein